MTDEQLLALERQRVQVARKLRATAHRIAEAKKVLAIAEADAAPLQIEAESLHRRIHDETMARYAQQDRERQTAKKRKP